MVVETTYQRIIIEAQGAILGLFCLELLTVKMMLVHLKQGIGNEKGLPQQPKTNVNELSSHYGLMQDADGVID